VLALSGASFSGKSWICRLKLIIQSLQNSNTFAFATATTHTATKRAIIEPLLRFLGEHEIQHVANFQKGEGWVLFKNGSRIEIFSTDNMMYRLRSREFSLGFLEEAITIPERDIESIVNESIRRLREPSPPPYHLMLATNPGLKTSWLYKNIFGNDVQNDIFARHIPFDEGFNKDDQNYVHKLRRASEHEQQIFYHGKWGVLAGQAFQLAYDKGKTPAINPGNRFHISFDYGFMPDPQVYLLIENAGSRLIVRREIELYETPISQHSKYLDRWFEEFKITAFTGDNSPGSAEVRNLLQSKYKLSYYPTIKTRNVGWTTLQDLFSRDSIFFDECPRCIESLESLIWMTNKQDLEPGDDHHADALRYYVMSQLYKGKESYVQKPVSGLIINSSPRRAALGSFA